MASGSRQIEELRVQSYVAAKCMFVAARKYLFKLILFLTFTFRKRMPCLERVYAGSCQTGRDICSKRDFCSNKINFASSELPLVFAASQFCSQFAAAQATASLPMRSWFCRCKAGFCLCRPTCSFGGGKIKVVAAFACLELKICTLHEAQFADAIAGLWHLPPVILDNVDEGQISFFLYICPQSVKDDRAIDSICFAPQIRPVGLI